MRSRSDAFVRLTLAVAAVLTAMPSARGEGIPMGPFEFYPSFSLEAGNDGNVFNRNEAIGVVSDRYAFVRAPLLLRLPFLNSGWDISYTPGWNGYQDNTDLDGMTHEVTTDLELNFSNGAQLDLGGGVLFDYLNTTFSQGEVAFSATDYQLRDGNLEYRQPLGARNGLRFAYNRESLAFADSTNQFLADRRTNEFGAFYVRTLAPSTAFLVQVAGARNWQERVQFQLEEGPWTEQGLQLGVEHEFSQQRDTLQFYAGYRRLRFKNSDDSDFDGFVGEFRYDRAISASISLNVSLLRQPFPSVYNVNNFYLTNRLVVTASFRPAGRMFYTLSIAPQRNKYPDEVRQFCTGSSDPLPPGVAFCSSGAEFFDPESIGTVRKDTFFLGSASIGVQIARTSAVELTYTYAQRNTNVEDLSFESPQVFLTFRFGWAPDQENI